MKKRTLDCVEMMHKGAEYVRQQVEGMTLEEQARFLHEQTSKLRQRQQTAEQRKVS